MDLYLGLCLFSFPSNLPPSPLSFFWFSFYLFFFFAFSWFTFFMILWASFRFVLFIVYFFYFFWICSPCIPWPTFSWALASISISCHIFMSFSVWFLCFAQQILCWLGLGLGRLDPFNPNPKPAQCHTRLHPIPWVRVRVPQKNAENILHLRGEGSNSIASPLPSMFESFFEVSFGFIL